MAATKKAKKTTWKDIGDLRLPHPAWRLGGAARWFEERLGLPSGAVAFHNPDNSKPRTAKTLTALRRADGRLHLEAKPQDVFDAAMAARK